MTEFNSSSLLRSTSPAPWLPPLKKSSISFVIGLACAVQFAWLPGATSAKTAKSISHPPPATNHAAQTLDNSPKNIGDKTVQNAQMFYEVLVGEVELQSGNLGNAYQLILNAARRNHDDKLFRRAVEIAIQGQAGEQALMAAKAWRTANPNSRDACEYMAQIFLAMNRPNEIVEPLRAAIKLTPPTARTAAILSVPRFLNRLQDRKQSAQLVDEITSPSRANAATQAAAWAASGQGWLLAGDTERAFSAAQQALAGKATDDAALALLVELIGRQPKAEALLQAQLKAQPTVRPSNQTQDPTIRLVYARKLIQLQRLTDAATQLELTTNLKPQLEPAWLTLGAVRLDLHQPEAAQSALEKYLTLVEKRRAKNKDKDPAKEDKALATPEEQQAYLMLAQAAEQRNNLKDAQTWLTKISPEQGGLLLTLRKAHLLFKQGHLAQARQTIQQSPAQNQQEARAKLMAEVTLLREAEMWPEAYALLEKGAVNFPDDVDILYEQSMFAEKLQRYEEMEQLAKRVIKLAPDSPNGYNALGFSLADRNIRLEEAKQLILQALERAPGDPLIMDSLGWVEFRLGNVEEATKILTQAYKNRPDPEIAAHLGEALWVQGKTDQARQIWDAALEKNSSNEILIETLKRLKAK